MSIRLTDEQAEAVTNRGGSLLVSAAAGSGKTKVLVERLFSYITDPVSPADVTDFLIITYTKAAAAELRMKIAAELSSRLAEDADNLHLQKQSLLIYRADVRTVDSFCTTLLRENIHLVGDSEEALSLTADFRVLDEREATLLRNQVLERVLEDFYDTLDEDGALLADTIGAGRDDSALARLVLQIYGKLQSHTYPMQWIENQLSAFDAPPLPPEQTAWGKELIAAASEKLLYWEKQFNALRKEIEQSDTKATNYLPALCSAQELFRSFRKRLEQGWDAEKSPDFPSRIGTVRGDSFPLKERAQALWKQGKEDYKKIQKQFSWTSAEIAEDLSHTAPAARALLRLTASFSNAYAKEKIRRNVTDFSDQEHFALSLLVERDGTPTELGRSVAGRYREIMIDEFQDTNEVQSRIFSAVSKGEKNLFMVGDMKQSIYRFRLADPTIFLDHYQRAPMYDAAQDGQERKVILSKNFRSRRAILDAANFICGNLMSPQMGEIEYTEQQALHFGAEYYEEKDGCETEFYLIDYTKSEDNDAKADASRALAEARFVAHRIRMLLDKPFLVQDEAGGQRAVTPEDIVILMRSPGARRRVYEQALAERGIACCAEGGEDFFSAMEVAVTVAMLHLIDNPRQDVPLICALRSPVFAFSPDRLAGIRANCPRGDFYTALLRDDCDDTHAFLAGLDELRFLAPDMSVHRLLWHLYNRFNLLGVFGAMDDGAVRRERLIALYEHARSFEGAGYRGLFRFVSHLRALLEAGETIPAPAKTADRGVRLMSIHKSKGLEFPVVILSDLSKSFNTDDTKPPVLVHPSLGIGSMRIDLTRKIRYSTPPRDAIAQRIRREQQSEELRVLYVALTRAKEKLILTASTSNAPGVVSKLRPFAACPVDPMAVSERRNMAQWVLLPLLCRTESAPLRGGDTLETPFNAGSAWHTELVDGALYRERPPHRQILTAPDRIQELSFDPALLSFRYPYAPLCNVPAKLTATQLKGRLVDQRLAEDTPQASYNNSFPEPLFLQGTRKLTAAERGTAMHMVMRFLDYSKTDSSAAIAAEVQRMVSEHFLTAEQGAAVDCAQLLRLFRGDLGQILRSVAQEDIHREFRFCVLEPIAKYRPEYGADDTFLLQGAVDCFFETRDGLTVIDFKTDRIRPGEERERAENYRVQLTAYCDVVSRIFQKPIHRRILYFFATDATVLL